MRVGDIDLLVLRAVSMMSFYGEVGVDSSLVQAVDSPQVYMN
jgi:hypothetical protein